MNQLNKTGIYQILNLINNKSYIGSSTTLRGRKNNHWYNLRRNQHSNSHLQRAYNKYGEENFTISALEEFEFLSKEHLEEKEDYWIDKFDSISNGYNKQKAKKGTFTQKWMERNTNKRKGRVINYKKIEQYDLKTQSLIKLFNSVDKVLMEFPELNKVSLYSHLTKNGEYSNLFPFSYINKQKKFPEESKTKILELVDGNIIKIYNNAKEILLDYPEIKFKGLQKVLYQNRKSIQGHFFILERNYKP
jgi:hypothetical protein